MSNLMSRYIGLVANLMVDQSKFLKNKLLTLRSKDWLFDVGLNYLGDHLT
jgi:hypothetical protein